MRLFRIKAIVLCILNMSAIISFSPEKSYFMHPGWSSFFFFFLSFFFFFYIDKNAMFIPKISCLLSKFRNSMYWVELVKHGYQKEITSFFDI